MAIVTNGNSAKVDATGVVIDRKNVKLTCVIFTPNASGDSITLTDGNGGDEKVTFEADSTATVMFDLSNSPLLFPNGIYCSAISASSKATLIGMG